MQRSISSGWIQYKILSRVVKSARENVEMIVGVPRENRTRRQGAGWESLSVLLMPRIVAAALAATLVKGRLEVLCSCKDMRRIILVRPTSLLALALVLLLLLLFFRCEGDEDLPRSLAPTMENDKRDKGAVWKLSDKDGFRCNIIILPL